jgi:alpha-beta hydrolase superfamily lysophospholipase
MLFTKSGNSIAYDWYPAENLAGYLLLLHMMPATKESWKEFAAKMQKENYASIAIDLRGHGESEGGPEGYKKFSDDDHQKSILDLDAAVDFLKKQGAAPEKIVLIGASIGANLALWYLAEHPEIKVGVLLSAGLDYRGIETEPLVKKLSSGQAVLFLCAKDDVRSGRDNPSMNQRLFEAIPESVKKEIIVFEKGGHGTDFLNQAEKLIHNWIADNLPKG